MALLVIGGYIFSSTHKYVYMYIYPQFALLAGENAALPELLASDYSTLFTVPPRPLPPKKKKSGWFREAKSTRG